MFWTFHINGHKVPTHLSLNSHPASKTALLSINTNHRALQRRPRPTRGPRVPSPHRLGHWFLLDQSNTTGLCATAVVKYAQYKFTDITVLQCTLHPRNRNPVTMTQSLPVCFLPKAWLPRLYLVSKICPVWKLMWVESMLLVFLWLVSFS